MYPCLIRSLPIALGVAVVWTASLDCLQAASPYGFNQNRVATPAMQYFGGRGKQPANVSSQQFHRQMPAPQPLQLKGSKPFESLRREPTISPYLNLDVRESEFGIPSYHAFVQPMQQQRLVEREQARRFRKLQQKVRVATARGIVSKNPTGGVPTTGRSSQYLNLGGYFSTAQ